jgi:hypothetical protein
MKLQPVGDDAPDAPPLRATMDISPDPGDPPFHFGASDPTVAEADGGTALGSDGPGPLERAGLDGASLRDLLDAVSQRLPPPDPPEAYLTTQELIAGLQGASMLVVADALS